MPLRAQPPPSLPQDQIGEVLEAARPAARRVLFRYRIPPEDAEDLLQDAALQLLRHWNDLEEPVAWLSVHLRFLCLNYWRARRRQLYEAVDEALLDSVGEPDRPEVEATQIRLDVGNVLRRIPSRCRQILRLRYGLGCEPAEVAREVGCRRSSVGQVTKRCVSALTRVLFAGGYA